MKGVILLEDKTASFVVNGLKSTDGFGIFFNNSSKRPTSVLALPIK